MLKVMRPSLRKNSQEKPSFHQVVTNALAKAESTSTNTTSYQKTAAQRKKPLGSGNRADRYEASDLQEEESKIQRPRCQTMQSSRLDIRETRRHSSLKTPKSMLHNTQQEQKTCIEEDQEPIPEDAQEFEVRKNRFSSKRFTMAIRKGFFSLFIRKQAATMEGRSTSVDERSRAKINSWFRKNGTSKALETSIQNSVKNLENDNLPERRLELEGKKDRNASIILTTKPETQETPCEVGLSKTVERAVKSLASENNKYFPKGTLGSLNSLNSRTNLDETDPTKSELLPSVRSVGTSDQEAQSKKQLTGRSARSGGQEIPSRTLPSTSEEIEIVTTKDHWPHKATSKQDLETIEHSHTQPTKTSIELAERDAEPGGTTTKASLIRFIGYVTLYFCIAIVISIISAIIANDYRGPGLDFLYHHWAHALFEGFFIAAVVAIILRQVLNKAEAENHLVVYKHFWVFVLVSLALSPLVSVAFFRFVDSTKYSEEIPTDDLNDPQNPDSISNWSVRSQFFYLLCKLPIVLLNYIIYQIYFFSKKFKHLHQTKYKKRSFFYADIYKNFQEELNKIKSSLHERQKNGQQKPLPTLESDNATTTQTKPDTLTMADIIVKTQHNLHNVVSWHRNGAAHLIIAVLLCQFLVSFGYLAIVQASIENSVGFFIVFSAVFYPIIIGVMKELAMRVEASEHVGIDAHVIHMMSMMISAVTYRSIYFLIDTRWQAICVILIKVAYKIIVYAFYGRSVGFLRKLWEKIKEKFRSLKEIYQQNQKQHTEHKKTPLRRTSKVTSVFERITLEDKFEKQYLKNFSSRFAILQMTDCMSIISLWVTLGIFNSSSSIDDVFKRHYSPNKVGRIIEFTGIELAFDIGLVILIALLMRRSKIFKTLKVLRVLNEILKSSLLVFVGISFMVFYSFYLVFTSYF